MRFALRNKTKLINAFGEAYYNELIASLIAFNLTTRPIAIIGTRRYKKKCWICQVVPTRIRHFRLPL